MKKLTNGETFLVQGSAKKPYEIKNVGGVISCDCKSWRNQSLSIDLRTCKHIKANVEDTRRPKTDMAADIPELVEKSKANVPPCILAHSWDTEQDVSGWIKTNKYDGLRAIWDGKQFWSRNGKEYFAPQWFKDLMPKDMYLDGELFAGNNNFQGAVSAIRKYNAVDSEWENVKYIVFDMPKLTSPYLDRLAVMALLKTNKHLAVAEHLVVSNREHVFLLLKEAEGLGYEGVMLREPKSLYEEGRSHNLLKVKSFKDCEATVVGYVAGKGRHKGRLGALTVKLDNGIEFNVGSGFTDQERENPIEIGERITIKFQEHTAEGSCRFPTFFRKP